MSEVIDFNKKKRELKRKKELEKEMEQSIYRRPVTKQDKIDEAMKKFGSHRKNKQNDKEGSD